MASGNGQFRIDPTSSNVVGEMNQDSKFSPEFVFNHGIVKQVINEEEDLSTTIHSEAEVPSDLSQCILITLTSSELESDYIKDAKLAQPLMRGFSDSISKGDSVIVTSIGGTLFYLGPINTANNPNYSPNTKIFRSTDLINDGDIENPNYHKMNIKKANKIKIPILDHPYETLIGDYGSAVESESSYSDLQLEGRHGNSIKIGSRFINPYIVIGNNNITGTNNGSVLGMLSLGSITGHFSDFTQLSVNKVVAEANENEEPGYRGFPIGHGNDSKGTSPENIFNNDFGAVQESPELQTEFDQIIMFSDRITFDAQQNDFTVSAFRNINFGAGKNFTLTNKGFSVFESKNIYIGEEAKKRTEPMVLGNKLKELLITIMEILKDANALVQGVPVPLIDSTNTPLTVRVNEVLRELNNEYKTNYDDEAKVPESDRSEGGPGFYSHHHFIETNRS